MINQPLVRCITAELLVRRVQQICFVYRDVVHFHLSLTILVAGIPLGFPGGLALLSSIPLIICMNQMESLQGGNPLYTGLSYKSFLKEQCRLDSCFYPTNSIIQLFNQ